MMEPADRFRQDLTALTGAPARLGIAVSGGPDSMALLYLAHAALPGLVEAATVDHGLRAQAADEAHMVSAWCAAHAIPHAILRPPEPIGGNIQSAARKARYALLERWRVAQHLDWIATAHHADDQLETLLMRLNRGAGVDGLAAIRARNGRVIRPLLGWRRAELAAVVQARGLPFVTDPSNVDPRYDRAALRAKLDGVDWLDPHAATRSAAALADAQQALDWMVEDLAARYIRAIEGIWHLTMPPAPREIRRRLLLALLNKAAPDAAVPRGDAQDGALARLEAGGKTSLGDWLLEGGDVWTIRPAPPRRKL